MSGYVFDPKTTFLNSVFLEGTGNRLASPELRQIIATNKTKDAVLELTKIQGASLHGQRLALDLQRDGNDELHSLNDNLTELARDAERGLSELSNQVGQMTGDIQSGFRDLNQSMGHLAEGMDEGFSRIGLGLQTGFDSVVKSLLHVDRRLGARVVGGFSMLSGQLAQQHVEMASTMIGGFDDVVDMLGKATQHIAGTIQHGTEVLVDSQQQAASAIVQAVGLSASQIVDSQQRSTQAVLQALERHAQELKHELRSQAANESEEHFLVGMRFFNHRDLPRAHQQFVKARDAYAGHFSHLLADGVCCRMLGREREARDALEAALAQVSRDVNQGRRQRSIAALYLGRLAFDRGDFAASRRWFHDAHTHNSRLHTALAEGAASLILDGARLDRVADARAIKSHFNSQGTACAYICWYLLALVLAPCAAKQARSAFQHGAAGDPDADKRDRSAVIARLWRLNARTAGQLLDIVLPDYPWLN